MKYFLNRETSLMMALDLHLRKFKMVYVAESGIYPYAPEMSELNEVMLTEPNCICSTIDVIAAIRATDSRSLEIKHTTSGVNINGEFVESNNNIE